MDGMFGDNIDKLYFCRRDVDKGKATVFVQIEEFNYFYNDYRNGKSHYVGVDVILDFNCDDCKSCSTDYGVLEFDTD